MWFVALLLAGAAFGTLSAQAGPPADIPGRAKGAEQVVVAKVVELRSEFDINVHGDQLIVSHALLQVEDTFKGNPAAALQLVIDGGTVGDLTLEVSDLPSIEEGDRGVFFLERTPSGTRQLHGRGLGLLLLDANDHVQGTNLTLDDVRRAVKEGK